MSVMMQYSGAAVILWLLADVFKDLDQDYCFCDSFSSSRGSHLSAYHVVSSSPLHLEANMVLGIKASKAEWGGTGNRVLISNELQ